MPLARIVTACVTEAVPLARRLREQGYSVEIVSPGTLVATPADVEFTVDRRPAAAALERAAEFSSAYDADVHVAPGTLAVERPLPKAPAAPAGEVVSAPSTSAAPPLSHPFLERQGGESLRTPQLPEASPTKTETHPFRDACQQAQAAMRDAWKSAASQVRAVSRDVTKQASGVKAPLRAGAMRFTQLANVSGKQAASRAKDLGQRLRAWEGRVHAKAAPRAAAFGATAKQNVAATTKTELQRAGRLAAAAISFLRAVPAALASLAQRTAAAVPRPVAARRDSARRREWNFAFAGAAAASLIMTLGWAAYTNRRPAADLLPRAAESVPQPDKGATLAPSAAPIAPAALTTPAPQASVPRPRPQSGFARPESDESDDVAEDSVVYHGAPKETADAQEEDDAEVTVRHHPRKTREQAATPSPPGVKKISDLD